MSLQSPKQSQDIESAQARRRARKAAAHKKSAPWRRYVKVGAALVVMTVVGWLIWEWVDSMSGVRREQPKEELIIPMPPPPEPEEQPEPEPEPEPEEVVEPEPEPEPEEPTPTEEPKPEEPPSPSKDLAEAMQIDGEAQAGADAFNIGAGSGGGMAGSGAARVGNATYGQYLSYAFQEILQDNEEVKHLSYRVVVNVWLDKEGRVTRVEMLKPSGDKDVDEMIITALQTTGALDQRPPPSLRLPVKMSLQGRRPG